jgi:predicted permease
VLRTVRHSVVHPVVLPILLGLAFHATGLPLPGPVDDVLATLAAAVVPVSLVTIGLSLQHYGVRGSVSSAAWMSLAKLGLHPAVVFAAGLAVGLSGLPLVVAVLCAALPTGANVLIFAGRYAVLRPQVTATIVIATTGFAATGSLWLLALSPRL